MPRALNVGLTKDDRALRRFSIGGSDANTLMSGDPTRILQLWRIKTGREEPPDLSNELRVVMGQWTEELNRHWFEKITGRAVTSEGKRRTRKGYAWMTVTLDGLTTTGDGAPCVFEAKHVGPFNFDRERLRLSYMPQLAHQMCVVGVEYAMLSYFIGNDRWECVEVMRDPFYEAALVEIEEAFWRAVTEDREPAIKGYIPASPIQPGDLIEIDMTGRNEWADLAASYIETEPAARLHYTAGDGLKKMVPENASRCFGHGLEIKRDRRGSLRITMN
jgi:predicted phage-related endonuclease